MQCKNTREHDIYYQNFASKLFIDEILDAFKFYLVGFSPINILAASLKKYYAST